MTEIQMLTWLMGLGFAGLGSMMLYLVSSLKQDINRLDEKLDKLDEKVTDIDRRLCRIEGAMMNKECCMLQHDHKSKVES